MPLSNILETFLEDRHVPYGLRHHALALSSLGAARAAHIDEHFLAKSVLLEDADGPVLAVLPASRRLELSRVRSQLGRSLRLSRERDMDRFFPDCQPGALPPFGSAYGLPTLVDRSLETCPVVFFEAGDHETLVRMEGQVFLGLLHDATRAEIASEGAAWPAVGIVRGRLYNSVLRVDEHCGDRSSSRIVDRDRGASASPRAGGGRSSEGTHRTRQAMRADPRTDGRDRVFFLASTGCGRAARSLCAASSPRCGSRLRSVRSRYRRGVIDCGCPRQLLAAGRHRNLSHPPDFFRAHREFFGFLQSRWTRETLHI